MMELSALPLENLKYSLFLKRRFLPIFLATFLGAFNDNMLRSGLVVLIAYSATKGIELPTRPEILVTICSALLVVPMLLFSSLAGSLADKCEKSRLVIFTKFAEVAIMGTALYGFATHNIYLLMSLLFISGTHTTFYGPIKFSILPDHLNSKELLAGNGFMAAGSYLAILLGMVTGGILVELPHNAIGQALVSISAIGLFASLFIPASHSDHPDTEIHWNLWHGTKQIVLHACRDKTVVHSILALSWFLLVSSVFISQFANYAEGVVHGNNEVYILFLTVFSLGVAAGSLLCDTLLKGEISIKMLPYAALGVSIFIYTMIATTPQPQDGLIGFWEFIGNARHWPMLCSMFGVACCGGIYVVPLYAVLQAHTESQYRSRVIAASNLSDAVLVTLAAIISALLLSLGCGILDLFLIVASLNLGVVWYARKVVA